MESIALGSLTNQIAAPLFENPSGAVPRFCSGVEAVFDCPSNDEPFVGEILC
jgi:hypothetical protein